MAIYIRRDVDVDVRQAAGRRLGLYIARYRSRYVRIPVSRSCNILILIDYIYMIIINLDLDLELEQYNYK
jgi:hypothetical protein